MSAPSRSRQISGEENISEPIEYSIKDGSSNSDGAKPKSKDSSNGIVECQKQPNITNIEENGYNEPITTNEVVPKPNSSSGITSVSSTADLNAIQRYPNQLPLTNDTETNSETKNTVKTSLIHSNSLVSKNELARTNNGDTVNIIKIQTVHGHQDKFLNSEKAVNSLSHQENLEMQEYQTRGPDVANTSAQNRDLNGTGSDHVAESGISSDNMGTGYESKHLSEDMYLQTQANNSEREDYNDTGQASDTTISSNVEKSEEKKLKKPKKSSAKTEKLSTAEKLDKSQQEHIVRKAANVREAVKAHREGKRRGQESSDEEEEEEKTLETSPDGKYYKVNQEIGRGSFKTVYRGLDANTGVAVAWCELMENNVKKEERQRFREEAAMLKGLQHPNIVRFYDFWEVKKQDDSKKTAQSNVQDHSMRLKGRRSIVIITELMTSGTLKKYIGRFRAIPERLNARVLKSWCRQILKGLYFLHTRTPPIIHRDLKCDNIFITGGTGSIKIGDLGLATLKTQSVAKSVIGTPEFMAPEMYDEEYDEAVDVYAFGMCMLEMTTNEYPYRECTGPAQIFRRVTGGVKPKSFAKVDSPDFRALIDWCTKSEKDDRPTIKQLIGHPFFEDPGFTLELVNRDAVIEMRESMATFRLRFTDQRKQGQNREAIGKHKEGEAIEFNFNLESDNTVEVTSSMLQSGILKNEEDRKTVANAMETQVSALLKDRNEVPDENEEEQDVNNEQNPSSPEPPPSPPPSPVPTNHPVLQNNNHSIDPMTLQYQSLQQSKDMDVIKSHGTERLAVSNTVSETLAVENPQHSNDGTTDSGYQTQPGLATNSNVQFQATKGNLIAATRPSIPNFEIQQGTESTAYTDSDADYESGKPQQRKSKPEKKKKRTTNLGPRVRVVNSTAITDSGGDVSEVKLECHLEVKSEDSCGKTLTFEFSYPDVDPDEISHEFVKTNYIKEQHREIVLHQLNDIIRQLNENVTKTPVVAFPPDIQQPLNLPQSNAIKTDALQKNNMDEIEKPQDVENDSTTKSTHTTTNRNEAGRFSISSVTDTGISSSTASPTRSRFSVERIEAPVNSIAPKDNDQLAENATGRFAVTQMSDSAFETQSSPFSTQHAENIEMTGSVSSTVSSGGNNTPFVEGTPTSTIHSQHGNHNERQYSDPKGYIDQVEQQDMQKHTNPVETHHVLSESKTTDKEKDGSGVTLDMEFTQKLQDIMGKGSQSPAVNTPSIINKNETDVDTLSQQAIPNSSGGNSRFSVSPVSENKNMNTSIGGTTEESLIDEHGRGISTVRESSPSPAGSNYTTASESERQNVNEAVNTIYEDKIGSTQQQASQEIMVNQSNNNDRKLQIDQHTHPINPNQEQLSSTSSASTIVAGNDSNTIPISPNQSDIKSTSIGTAVSINASDDAVSNKQDNMSAMIRDLGSSKVNVSEDNPVQISEAIRSLDERHRTEVVEHNKRLDDLRKLYLKERQELSSMLVSAIQRQEVRSDTISATDIQQTQPVSSTSSSMATAAMQMQQQQHHQMTGTGGVQIVPFVNTDGSIQPINLVPQQLSVSSMQQFQMLQQNQHSLMNQQQYSGGLHMQGSKTQNQVNLQQVASSSQGISTPPVVTQQSSFPNAQAQPLRSISQQQTQQINTQGQQASQQQTPVQPQTIRPVQQYQGQQSQPLTSTAQLPQPTATMPQEQQKLYQNSAPSSQVAAQNTPNCTPAAQTPVPQPGGHNVSSQAQGLSSNNRQHQSVSNSSHVQGARVDQGSNGHASQVNTAPQQTVPPTYYFAPQPTYSVIPGVGETSNNVQPAHWPQIPTMAYIPHQSSNQLIHTTQPSLNSVPTSSADAANSMSNDNRPPSLAGHAFHHYQNGSSHAPIPHQLVLVPQPQNYAYLPHSGGHLPYNTYHQQPGLHGVPAAAGFAPLQPAVGHGSTSSPTPSAASQTSQQPVSQDSSAPAFNKSVHQVHQSTVKMVAESTGADVTSAHAQVIQSNPANQTSSVTGQQTTIPLMPHVVSQMQSQYQANLQALQPIQHMGIAQNSVIPAQQQQHVQIPIGNVIHASATSTGVDPNDRGLSANGIESSILNQAQSQATANTQQMQQQLSGTPQSSQGQGSS